jgi:hypothetical protein
MNDEFAKIAERALDRVNGASHRLQEKMEETRRKIALVAEASTDEIRLKGELVWLGYEADDLRLRAQTILRCADLAEKCPDTADDMKQKIATLGDVPKRHLQ